MWGGREDQGVEVMTGKKKGRIMYARINHTFVNYFINEPNFDYHFIYL